MRVRRRDYGTKDEREQTIQRRRKRLREREMESSSKLVEGQRQPAQNKEKRNGRCELAIIYSRAGSNEFGIIGR
jgi:hypothetical protein